MKTTKLSPAKCGTFRECTYTDGTVEVMVHRDSQTGRVFHVYAYTRDCAGVDALRGDDKRGKPLPGWTWETGRNPAFRHLAAAQVARFVRELIDSGELIDTEENRDA